MGADDCALLQHENPAATCTVSCGLDYNCDAIAANYQPSAWENAAVVLIVIAALWWWVKRCRLRSP